MFIAGDTIAVDTNAVHQAGQTIYNNTLDLQKYMDNYWVNFGVQTGEVAAMCLRNDFYTFRDKHEPQTKKMIENRLKIGKALQDSATLWEFEEKVTAKSFDGPNIYSLSPYNSSQDFTNPQSLRQPDGFTH